jgi:large subunit ribosomal protein L15e
MYKYIRDLWKSPSKELLRERLIAWRKEPVIVRIDRPTRLDRARTLGYKAKQGFAIVRIKVAKSKRQRPLIKKGRRSKHRRRKKIVGMSYQWIAEGRVAKKYTNMEVLNSYIVCQDGKHKWYEVILIDREHPRIKNDHRTEWVKRKANTGRVYRGLTSAGKKSRGMLNKGKGAEKIRPSLRANKGLAK